MRAVETIPEMTRGEFLRWCERHGLDRNEMVASVFHLSSQTIRNWKREPHLTVPSSLLLCAKGYEAWRKAGLGDRPTFPDASKDWFTAWRERRGIANHAELGREFGHRRQTIFKWYQRDTLPPWVPLACLGIDAIRAGIVAPGTAHKS